ncbi:MAG: hypothetical protein JOY84_11425 [Curvibacter sp.]|nr:hypothetical protein [Curvibacter sp.]
MPKTLPMRCDQCRFWHRLDTQSVPDLMPGHCHRFPPVQVNSIHEGPSAKRDPAAWSVPVVHASAWCGEFRAPEKG